MTVSCEATLHSIMQLVLISKTRSTVLMVIEAVLAPEAGFMGFPQEARPTISIIAHVCE